MDDASLDPALLRHMPAFARLPPPLLDALAFAFVETSHAPNDVIRGPGASSCAHLVLEGEVAVRGVGRENHGRLGRGALFGLSPWASGSRYRAIGSVRTAALGRQGRSLLAHAPSDPARAIRHALESLTRRAGVSEGAPVAASFRKLDMNASHRLIHAAAIGGIVSTAVASIACVGPLFGVMLGIGGMGVLSGTAALRVPATIASFVLLGLGFWIAYRPGRTCADRRRAARVQTLPWVATAFALTMALFVHVTLPRLG